LVKEGAVPEPLKPAAATVLLNVWRTSIVEEASEYFDVPADAGAEQLPPIRSLVASASDPDRGGEVFTTYCSRCHVAGGQGENFGPDLSEIGDKLSKEGLFTAILQPDAGISFGYEGVLFHLNDGTQALGYVVSETAQEVELRLVDASTRTIATADIASREPLETSLMPALQGAMTRQELVDLVAYLHALKKPAS
jgi:putative heme-binding domain-containing protein